MIDSFERFGDVDGDCGGTERRLTLVETRRDAGGEGKESGGGGATKAEAVPGRGGREVTTGSNFILRARLSREPLLLFSFFVDNSSLVPSVVLMVRGVVASLLLLLLLLAVARSRLLEVLKLQFEEILSLLLSRLLEETKLEETRSSTVVGSAKVVLANSATVRGTLEKAVNEM